MKVEWVKVVACCVSLRTNSFQVCLVIWVLHLPFVVVVILLSLLRLCKRVIMASVIFYYNLLFTFSLFLFAISVICVLHTYVLWPLYIQKMRQIKPPFTKPHGLKIQQYKSHDPSLFCVVLRFELLSLRYLLSCCYFFRHWSVHNWCRFQNKSSTTKRYVRCHLVNWDVTGECCGENAPTIIYLNTNNTIASEGVHNNISITTASRPDQQ